jgi:hypothetical protein
VTRYTDPPEQFVESVDRLVRTGVQMLPMLEFGFYIWKRYGVTSRTVRMLVESNEVTLRFDGGARDPLTLPYADESIPRFADAITDWLGA